MNLVRSLWHHCKKAWNKKKFSPSFLRCNYKVLIIFIISYFANNMKDTSNYTLSYVLFYIDLYVPIKTLMPESQAAVFDCVFF